MFGKLFVHAKKGSIWSHLEVASAVAELGTTRERVVKALGHLEEHGDLTLKVAGLRQGYRIKNHPADAEALKRTLVGRFQTREANDLQRVEQVVALAEGDGCIVRRLLAHFGEERQQDCGHCSACLGQDPQRISDDAPPAIAFDAEAVGALRHKHPRALSSPRQVARPTAHRFKIR